MAHLTLCQWLRGLAAANEAEQGSAVGRCRLTLTTTYDLSASSKPGINHNTTSPKSLPYSKLSAKLSLLHSKRARRHCAITGYGCKSLRYASFLLHASTDASPQRICEAQMQLLSHQSCPHFDETSADVLFTTEICDQQAVLPGIASTDSRTTVSVQGMPYLCTHLGSRLVEERVSFPRSQGHDQ